jgi:hypothetical protein
MPSPSALILLRKSLFGTFAAYPKRHANLFVAFVALPLRSEFCGFSLGPSQPEKSFVSYSPDRSMGF